MVGFRQRRAPVAAFAPTEGSLLTTEALARHFRNCTENGCRNLEASAVNMCENDNVKSRAVSNNLHENLSQSGRTGSVTIREYVVGLYAVCDDALRAENVLREMKRCALSLTHAQKYLLQYSHTQEHNVVETHMRK